MKRPHLFRVSAAFLAALAGHVAAPSFAAHHGGKPNIVMFVSDDQDWRDAGCYGNPDVRTPNIDRLAAEGTRFTHAFAGSPTCVPSRATLYSGLMPVRNGAFLNHSQTRPHVRTLPHYLRPLGYRVVLANKVHNVPYEAYPFEILKATLPRRSDRERNFRAEGIDTKMVDEFLAEHAATRGDQPLCLVVAASAPHADFQEIEEYDPSALTLHPHLPDTRQMREALARYYSDITDMDRKLGRIVDSLDRHGYADNTVFIYISDQGSSFPGGKWTVYEAGLRGQMIVKWPGVVKANAINEAMISYADFVPTLVEIAGGTPYPGLDGWSFLPVLYGHKAEHRSEIYGSHSGDFYHNPARSVRTRTHKLIMNLKPGQYTNPFVTFETPDHAPVWRSWEAAAKTDPHAAHLVQRFRYRPPVELYDLRSDPDEMHNLADDPAHTELITHLRNRIETFMALQSDHGMETENEALNHPYRVENMGRIRKMLKARQLIPQDL